MEKLKTNQRKIHRKITAISAIPLLITIVSGTIYSILQPLGVDAFWLIKWHTGNSVSYTHLTLPTIRTV